MADWFPDWRGETCVLVAAGPSARAANLDRLRDSCRVVVINRSFELAPWADALYACDRAFWKAYPAARQFAGMKITQDERAITEFSGLLHLPLKRDKNKNPIMTLSDEPGMIGGGANSGFQILDGVMQFGANPIYLVGFDMNDTNHWHEPHGQRCGNPTPQIIDAWVKYFHEAAPAVRARGVSVINTNPDSALKCFPFAPLETAAVDIRYSDREEKPACAAS